MSHHAEPSGEVSRAVVDDLARAVLHEARRAGRVMPPDLVAIEVRLRVRHLVRARRSNESPPHPL